MSTRIVVGVAAALCALLAFGRVAAAQNEDDDRKARSLYLAGEDDYAAGRYEQAAEKFERAYQLSHRSGLLFNIANCYERKGDYGLAADYLKRYLDSEDAEDLVSVRQRIRRLEAAEEAALEAERQRKKRKAAADDGDQADDAGQAGFTGTDGRSKATRNRDGREDGRPSPSRAPYYWLAGGGLAIAAGGTMGFLSRSAGSDAEAFCTSGFCDAAAQSKLDRERNFAIAADVSFGVGAAAVGVGLYLLLTRDDQPASASDRLSFHPVFYQDGIGIGIAGAL